MKRATLALLALPPALALLAQLAFDEPWWTSDQRGRRAFAADEYERAAELFQEPEWRAAALYRAGEFERTANALAGAPGPEAAYNRGNALVFLGRYEEAVHSYERALELRPEWAAAAQNRAIAEARIRHEVALGEATELGADEIVFGDSKSSDGDEVEVTAGEEFSDEALRALWLRSVETRPADFLRIKFAYQAARGADE